MNSIISKKSAWIISWLSFGLIAIYIFIQGPNLGADSYGYLRMDALRPLGYPLFLYLMRIFGDYQLMAVMTIQVLLNIWAASYFLKKIGSLFNLKSVNILLLLPFLLYTIVFFSRPDTILTEAVSFPLFLIVSIYILEGILTSNVDFLYKAIYVNTLLFLVREQFLFIYPLIGLLFIYLLYIEERKILTLKKVSIAIGVIALCLVGASLLNKSYHYFFHDTFSNPHMNVSFFPTAIYISELVDAEEFEDPAIRQSYRDLYQIIDREGLTMDHFYQNIYPEINPEERRRSDLIEHYHKHFESIQNITRDYYSENRVPPSEQVQNIIKRDNQLKTMTAELIKKEPWMFLYINFSDVFVYGFNNDRRYLILYFLLTFISFLGLIKRNKYGTILFFFLSGHLLNLLASSLSIKIIPRYTFYMTFMISTLLTIILIKFLLEEESSSGELINK